MYPNGAIAVGIGTEIARIRKVAGLTQPELAARAGVGLRFVRELEQGKPTVRLDKVKQVLDLLGHELQVRPKP
ncbi:MAG: helix-turn-helix transcriptional regulator [Planctomycetes bacterium]|nr:helix-turn-helix transcriptional regulator [Planctomycetota bacterium]